MAKESLACHLGVWIFSQKPWADSRHEYIWILEGQLWRADQKGLRLRWLDQLGDHCRDPTVLQRAWRDWGGDPSRHQDSHACHILPLWCMFISTSGSSISPPSEMLSLLPSSVQKWSLWGHALNFSLPKKLSLIISSQKCSHFLNSVIQHTLNTLAKSHYSLQIISYIWKGPRP